MKKITMLLAFAMLFVFCCTAMAETVSVAIVYSDTVDDKGWCQSMDTGIKNAIAKGYDIEYTPVESVAVPEAPNTLDQLAENYDIIIVHGAQFTSATTEIAAEYPDQIFAIGYDDCPSVYWINSDKYYTVSTEGRNYIVSLFEKYVGYFPFPKT